MTHNEAVQSVLAHWKELSEVETKYERDHIGIFSDKCAFCTLYSAIAHCSNTCPIKAKTGRNQCRDTPWYNVRDAHTDEEFKTAAKDMYEFIQDAVKTSCTACNIIWQTNYARKRGEVLTTVKNQRLGGIDVYRHRINLCFSTLNHNQQRPYWIFWMESYPTECTCQPKEPIEPRLESESY